MTSVAAAAQRAVELWASGRPVDEALAGLRPADADTVRAIARTRMLVIQHHGRRVMSGAERFDQIPRGWRDLVRAWRDSRSLIVKSYAQDAR